MTIEDDKKPTPNEWDLHPQVYREYKDGAKLSAPTEDHIKRMHEGVVPPETEDASSADQAALHPQKWKEYVDGKPVQQNAVPNQWDLYPQVYEKYVDGKISQLPTEAEIKASHDSIVADTTTGTDDMYPAKSRSE